MPAANLNLNRTTVDDGLDSIVIVKDLADIPGGRTLDVSGWDTETFGKFIKAGHFILRDKETGAFSPFPLVQGNKGAGYDATADLTSSDIVGVLKSTVSVEDPRAAILTVGQVNAAAVPYAIIGGIQYKLRTGFGQCRIDFINFNSEDHGEEEA